MPRPKADPLDPESWYNRIGQLSIVLLSCPIIAFGWGAQDEAWLNRITAVVGLLHIQAADEQPALHRGTPSSRGNGEPPV